MPDSRELLRARIRNSGKPPAPAQRAPPARGLILRQNIAPPPPARPHRRGEKRTLFGLVIFLAVLVGGGIIYSYSSADLSTPPPLPPDGASNSTQNGGFVINTRPTRIARIVIPGEGTMCSEISFDNDTGYFSLAQPVRCDAPSPKGQSSFPSFKGSFGRH